MMLLDSPTRGARTVAANPRAVIEQAKGFVAAQRGVPVDEAFDLLRRHAAQNRLPILDVARAVVNLRLDLQGSRFDVCA